MLFPILICKDEGSDYGVVVWGLPGCFSAGRTIEEALVNVREAIELHLRGRVEDGMEIPEQWPIGLSLTPTRPGLFATVVEVDTTPYRRANNV